MAQELEFSLMGDIWEVMANCHGPEDPPGALLRASAALHCPILALLATCYEVQYFCFHHKTCPSFLFFFLTMSSFNMVYS